MVCVSVYVDYTLASGKDAVLYLTRSCMNLHVTKVLNCALALQGVDLSSFTGQGQGGVGTKPR